MNVTTSFTVRLLTAVLVKRFFEVLVSFDVHGLETTGWGFVGSLGRMFLRKRLRLLSLLCRAG
jgi:hypothetical protein